MLYYLRSNVTLKVQGISGPFTKTIGWLVNADNPQHARQKYEDQVKRDFLHMQFSAIDFEYTEFAGEIK